MLWTCRMLLLALSDLFTTRSLKFKEHYLLVKFSKSNNDNFQEAGIYDQYIIFSL